MNKYAVMVTAMICGTVLGIFLLYHYLFSPYARCVNTGKEIINSNRTSEVNALKAKCGKSDRF